MNAPPDAAAFGRAVAAVLGAALGDGFAGAWFVGSLALGGYVGGESDIDIVAVCRQPVDDHLKPVVAERVLEVTSRCPTRGLELTLYRADVAASPPAGAEFEVNVNGGPRMDRSVHLRADEEPGFWYVLDRAIAYRAGRTITGPPARALFVDVGRPVLLDAMAASMRWHREHERATLYSVLNASRAWRFAADDVLGSKLEGAEWARERWPNPSLIDAAVDLRHGRPAQLDAQEVDAFLAHVERVLG